MGCAAVLSTYLNGLIHLITDGERLWAKVERDTPYYLPIPKRIRLGRFSQKVSDPNWIT